MGQLRKQRELRFNNWNGERHAFYARDSTIRTITLSVAVIRPLHSKPLPDEVNE